VSWVVTKKGTNSEATTPRSYERPAIQGLVAPEAVVLLKVDNVPVLQRHDYASVSSPARASATLWVIPSLQLTLLGPSTLTTLTVRLSRLVPGARPLTCAPHYWVAVRAKDFELTWRL